MKVYTKTYDMPFDLIGFASFFELLHLSGQSSHLPSLQPKFISGKHHKEGISKQHANLKGGLSTHLSQLLHWC
jgi:hypothetical protein